MILLAWDFSEMCVYLKKIIMLYVLETAIGRCSTKQSVKTKLEFLLRKVRGCSIFLNSDSLPNTLYWEIYKNVYVFVVQH